MSLRSFHLFFISLCSALSLGVSYWTYFHPQYAIIGLFFIAVGLGLIPYGVWFYKKTRARPKPALVAFDTIKHVILLALVIAAGFPSLAGACPVCVGPPQDPMIQGMQSAISILLGVTGFILMCFLVSIAVFWRRAVKAKGNAVTG